MSRKARRIFQRRNSERMKAVVGEEQRKRTITGNGCYEVERSITPIRYGDEKEGEIGLTYLIRVKVNRLSYDKQELINLERSVGSVAECEDFMDMIESLGKTLKTVQGQLHTAMLQLEKSGIDAEVALIEEHSDDEDDE